MYKSKGKEYPVSFYRLVLPDEVATRIDYIRNRMGFRNNLQVFILAINAAFNLIYNKELEEKNKSDGI